MFEELWKRSEFHCRRELSPCNCHLWPGMLRSRPHSFASLGDRGRTAGLMVSRSKACGGLIKTKQPPRKFGFGQSQSRQCAKGHCRHAVRYLDDAKKISQGIHFQPSHGAPINPYLMWQEQKNHLHQWVVSALMRCQYAFPAGMMGHWVQHNRHPTICYDWYWRERHLLDLQNINEREGLWAGQLPKGSYQVMAPSPFSRCLNWNWIPECLWRGVR